MPVRADATHSDLSWFPFLRAPLRTYVRLRVTALSAALSRGSGAVTLAGGKPCARANARCVDERTVQVELAGGCARAVHAENADLLLVALYARALSIYLIFFFICSSSAWFFFLGVKFKVIVVRLFLSVFVLCSVFV